MVDGPRSEADVERLSGAFILPLYALLVLAAAGCRPRDKAPGEAAGFQRSNEQAGIPDEEGALRLGSPDGGCSRVEPLPTPAADSEAIGSRLPWAEAKHAKNWYRGSVSPRAVIVCDTAKYGIVHITTTDTGTTFYYDKSTGRLVASRTSFADETVCRGDVTAMVSCSKAGEEPR
jgi:hypothetical protein